MNETVSHHIWAVVFRWLNAYRLCKCIVIRLTIISKTGIYDRMNRFCLVILNEFMMYLLNTIEWVWNRKESDGKWMRLLTTHDRSRTRNELMITTESSTNLILSILSQTVMQWHSSKTAWAKKHTVQFYVSGVQFIDSWSRICHSWMRMNKISNNDKFVIQNLWTLLQPFNANK